MSTQKATKETKSEGRARHDRGHKVKHDRDGLTRCRVCGCTETDACAGGCSWVDDDLCSVCDAAVQALAAWIHEARRANKTALWREATQKLESETR